MSNEDEQKKETQTEKTMSAEDPRLTQALQDLEDERKKSSEAMEIATSMKKALEEERRKAKKSADKTQKSQDEETASGSHEAGSDTSVASIIDEKLNEFKRTLATQERDRVLKTLTQDEKERQSILDHYENRIVHSGYDSLSIERDLKIARAAANIDHLEFKNQSSGSANAASALAGGSGKPVGAENVTEKQREIATMVGMDPEKFQKYSGVLDSLTHSNK